MLITHRLIVARLRAGRTGRAFAGLLLCWRIYPGGTVAVGLAIELADIPLAMSVTLRKMPVAGKPTAETVAGLMIGFPLTLAFLILWGEFGHFPSNRFALFCLQNKISVRGAMSRLLLATVLLVLLASCGGRYSAPQQLDNACAIVQERPKYLRAMQDTEQRWGVPVHVQMATIHQESKFIGNAKTPHKYLLGIIPMGRVSSAYGYSQALDGTWDDYISEAGRWGARRDRIDDATDFMGWYMHKSSEELGISKFDAQNQYLAYHEGRGGYRKQSYLAKPWLMDVSAKVARRAEMYRAQLASCGIY